jgi:hypothetical protein
LSERSLASSVAHQEEGESLDRDLDEREVDGEDGRVEVAMRGRQVEHGGDDEHEREVVEEVEVGGQHERVSVIEVALRHHVLVPLHTKQTTGHM